jgi:branched-chain amino acid transport system ATP-binding protein
MPVDDSPIDDAVIHPGRPADTPVAHALDAVAPEAGVAKPDAILVADGVQRTFGGLRAVDVAHLEVPRGVITALIGPNGAGKTTFFNLVTRFDRLDAGTVTFDGRGVERMAPHRVASLGMVRTFQLTKTLSRVTVIDNLRLGAGHQSGERLRAACFPPFWRAREQEITERADALIERFNLTRVRDDFAGTLSGGQRKLLDMARSLMAEPSLLMLDEPMAGVNPALRQELVGHMEELRDEGRSILFVEHDMDVVMGVSDWVVCMAEGQVIAEGRPRSVAGDERVIEAYLGARHEPTAPQPPGDEP